MCMRVYVSPTHKKTHGLCLCVVSSSFAVCALRRCWFCACVRDACVAECVFLFPCVVSPLIVRACVRACVPGSAVRRDQMKAGGGAGRGGEGSATDPLLLYKGIRPPAPLPLLTLPYPRYCNSLSEASQSSLPLSPPLFFFFFFYFDYFFSHSSVSVHVTHFSHPHLSLPLSKSHLKMVCREQRTRAQKVKMRSRSARTRRSLHPPPSAPRPLHRSAPL